MLVKYLNVFLYNLDGRHYIGCKYVYNIICRYTVVVPIGYNIAAVLTTTIADT